MQLKLCIDSSGRLQNKEAFFPNDDTLKKMLFFVYRDISKKWIVMPVQNWTIALSHLSIIFELRLFFNTKTHLYKLFYRLELF
jgi:transposase-like protein